MIGKKILFNDKLLKRGDIFVFSTLDENKAENIYYVEDYKKEKGVILLYTCASNEKYHQDLGRIIKRSRGGSQDVDTT